MTRLRLTYVPIQYSEHVYLNGVEQRFGTDYAFSEPGVIDTTTAADTRSGDTLECQYTHLNVITPAPPDPVYLGSMIDLNYDYRFNFTLPTGTVPGDLMLVSWSVWHNWAINPGWTVMRNDHGGGDERFQNMAAWKFVTTEVPGVQFTVNPSNGAGFRASGIMTLVRGVNPDNPIYQYADSYRGLPSTTVSTGSAARYVVHQGTTYESVSPTISRGTPRQFANLDNLMYAKSTDEVVSGGQTITTTTNIPNAGLLATWVMRIG